jgi:hypothetical protein
MRQITSILALLAALVTTTASCAGAHEVISAQDAATQAKAIKYGVDWVNSLPQAQEQARRSHKPIFWLHILGNIDGFA